jgi:mRNA-degrading endonuclease toxin of MazEF toxin-antitoxin module
VSWTGAVYRWDMFWADLEPGVGSEQKGERRPVIVVSNDGFNAAFPVVTVVPATKAAGKRRTPYPFEVLLPAGTITTKHESIVMPHQVRTISKLGLIERIGSLEGGTFREQLENRLLEHFGIAFEQESPGDVREA